MTSAYESLVGDEEPGCISRRAYLELALVMGGTVMLAGCALTESPGVTEARGLKDPVAQARAAMIISTFENSTLEVQYGYAENLDDGRGITAGRAGFCSGTGDMLLVVQRYTRAKPRNALASYLPKLEQIDKKFAATNWEEPVGSVQGLDGLEEAWRTAAEDEDFRKAQDEVFNELYLDKALEQAKIIKTADGLGINTAIGQLIILDTAIQQGMGTDNDGLPRILKDTSDSLGPNFTEQQYLSRFLDVRRARLMHSSNPNTRKEWRESVGRVDALRQILDSDNADLRGAMSFDVYEGDHWDIAAAE